MTTRPDANINMLNEQNRDSSLPRLVFHVSHGDVVWRIISFRDWENAHAHIRDHVLTEPETLGWHELSPLFREAVPVFEDRVNHTFSSWDEGSKNPNSWWRTLYELYTEQAALAIDHSARFDWLVGHGRKQSGLSLCGVFWAVDASQTSSILLTAFLPAVGGNSSSDGNSLSEPVKKQAYRQRDYRSAIFKFERHSDTQYAKYESTLQRADDKDWSSDRRIYQLLFRPAVQWIRKRRAAENRYEFSALHEKLGTMKSLDFDSWLERRKAVEGAAVLVEYES
ncbi:MAG: hypothetical protein KDB03_01530 [Planctomycetales bacterium]|nr:hypothetical protein [Planctomycetales bacterium]